MGLLEDWYKSLSLDEFDLQEEKRREWISGNWIVEDNKNYMQPTKISLSEFKKMAEQTNATETIKSRKQVYNIRVESPFILTQKQIKEYLGIGYKVISVETEYDVALAPITDVDSAVTQIIKSGYRALARAHHPDLGGDPEVMQTLNRARKELTDLLESLRNI